MEKFVDALRRKWVARFGGFVRQRFVPSMCHEETFNLAGGGENNGVIVLMDVDAIIFVEEATIFEGRTMFIVEAETLAYFVEEHFCNVLAWASNGKVVDLLQDKDGRVVNGSFVYAAVVCDLSEGQVKENGIDVGIPETARFRVAL